MKLTTPAITLVCMLLLVQAAKGQTGDAINVLAKTQHKISRIKQLGFGYTHDINYRSENYRAQRQGKAYLDFMSQDTLIGFRFIDRHATGQNIFNGGQQIFISDRDTTIDIDYKPRRQSLGSSGFLLNSPITLRYAIPKLLADETIGKTMRDTMISGKTHHLVSVELKNKGLSYLGDISKFTIQRTSIYEIIIDRKSYLPLQVIQKAKEIPGDYTQTVFSEYNLKPGKPAEYDWYASTYTDRYKPKKQRVLIAANTVAPLWELPLTKEKRTLRLDDLKGKVILLEFWFKNCGPCIEAVPSLNALNEEMKNKPFLLVGINAEDTHKDAFWFIDKRNVQYTTVYDGKKIAEEYGISAYPSAVLIDKTGKIVFAGAMEKEKLVELIEKTLSL
jgi:thiol-disulfide isomerase/thioredoxin